MIRVAPAEEGAALLAVLMLVAVMAAISVVALEKIALATRLAANGAALDQARGLALGGEAIALARIGQLANRERRTTTLAGGWQGRAFRMPVPGGIATARLVDGGNCFNLNSVAEGLVPTDLAPRPAGVQQFIALMRILEIPEGEAHRVAAATADWVDGDSIPNPDGAEDETYAGAATPYRAANTLIADPSELRAIAGVTPELYARLRPWVCALPTTDLSPLNVNTLTPEQAPLVAMLVPDQLDLNRARGILTARPVEGFENPTAFWKLPALEALIPPAEIFGQPQVRTRWFALRLDVELGAAQVREEALIDAGLVPARVVARRWGDEE